MLNPWPRSARSSAPTARLRPGHYQLELLTLVRATSTTTSTTSCQGQSDEPKQHELQLGFGSDCIPHCNRRNAQHVNGLGDYVTPRNSEHRYHLLSFIVDNQGDRRGHLI